MIHLQPQDRLTPKEIKGIVDKFKVSDRYKQLVTNIEYFKGQDTMILEREVPATAGGPDNRIPVSYGRRIINLVTGYMYRPGLVQYASEDEAYLEKLLDIFKQNKEPIKTEQMGKNTSIQGVGYEFHYVTENKKRRALPRFTKLPAPEVIPIYDYEVESNLWAFIRFLEQGEDKIVWIYYATKWEKFKEDKQGNLVITEKGRHFYNQVPLVVYQNNEETLGDFEPVMHLIDAYDVLISDSMNEFEKFAWAYLILKGMSLNDDDAFKLKWTRTFENLAPDATVEFLTKDMQSDFIKFMTDLIRAEIHRQAGIPNIEDYDGAGASGKTMSKFIYLMELFTDPKESYFKEGLLKRIELINSVLRLRDDKVGDVEIIMNRNNPDNSLEQAEIFNAYSTGISWETRTENFADFVKNVAAEKERVEKERDLFGDIDVEEEDMPDGTREAEDIVAATAKETALNGAQIKSLVDIIQNLAAGLISKPTAEAIIKAGFPGIPDELVATMLNNIKAISKEDVS